MDEDFDKFIHPPLVKQAEHCTVCLAIVGGIFGGIFIFVILIGSGAI